MHVHRNSGTRIVCYKISYAFQSDSEKTGIVTQTGGHISSGSSSIYSIQSMGCRHAYVQMPVRFLEERLYSNSTWYMF